MRLLEYSACSGNSELAGPGAAWQGYIRDSSHRVQLPVALGLSSVPPQTSHIHKLTCISDTDSLEELFLLPEKQEFPHS